MIEYLFDPDVVQGVLLRYPALNEKLRLNPLAEGKCSQAFPGMRRTKREIIRVLQYVDCYESLESLVSDCEAVFQAGVQPPDQFRGHGDAFQSALATVSLAHHWQMRGWRVQTLDAVRGRSKEVDLLLERGTDRIAIEVYGCWEWQNRQALLDGATYVAKNIDLPFDFSCRMCFQPASFAYPWLLDDAATPKVRARILGNLHRTLGNRLSARKPAQWRIPILPKAGGIEVEIDKVTKSGDWPVREVQSSDSMTGYAPNLMFERMARGKIKSKVEKKRSAWQKWPGHKAVLAVDLTHSELDITVGMPCYERAIEESMVRNFVSTPVDAILFFFRRKRGIEFRWHFANDPTLAQALTS